MSLHGLAELLHKFVWEVKELPASEYMAWVMYFEEKTRKQEVAKGNIMAMNPDEIARNFG